MRKTWKSSVTNQDTWVCNHKILFSIYGVHSFREMDWLKQQIYIFNKRKELIERRIYDYLDQGDLGKDYMPVHLQ